jgi:ribosome-associated toxin RatA of RatAB toxin-antitoxin module
MQTLGRQVSNSNDGYHRMTLLASGYCIGLEKSQYLVIKAEFRKDHTVGTIHVDQNFSNVTSDPGSLILRDTCAQGPFQVCGRWVFQAMDCHGDADS